MKKLAFLLAVVFLSVVTFGQTKTTATPEKKVANSQTVAAVQTKTKTVADTTKNKTTKTATMKNKTTKTKAPVKKDGMKKDTTKVKK